MWQEDKIDLAKELEAKAAARGVKFILPTDVVLADKFDAAANTKVAKVEEIPDGWMGLDNGPESTKMIQEELSECKTIIWNGAMSLKNTATVRSRAPWLLHAPTNSAMSTARPPL